MSGNNDSAEHWIELLSTALVPSECREVVCEDLRIDGSGFLLKAQRLFMETKIRTYIRIIQYSAGRFVAVFLE
jgi:hypothetical protein